MSDTAGWSGSDGLAQELARLRAERRRLAASLGGEDPRDPDGGDRGDQAQQLEGDDDLARVDRRIGEIQHLLAEPEGERGRPGLAGGTEVTLRFPDGEVATLRVVDVAAEVPEGGSDAVLTADSPLGLAVAGHTAGDTVVYEAPGGEARVELLDVRPPGPRRGAARG